MSIIDIIKYGDPRLLKVCKAVEDFSILPDIIATMYDSMYEAEGIGLAANQIGVDLKLFIIDITHTDEATEPGEFINSKIINAIRLPPFPIMLCAILKKSLPYIPTRYVILAFLIKFNKYIGIIVINKP